MTATITIMLIGLAVLVVLLLCMPAAVILAQWIEDRQPGLLENIAFWALVMGVTLTALFLSQFLLSPA